MSQTVPPVALAEPGESLRLDGRWTHRAGEVFRFEQAAFAAGIPMPEPISADPGVLVHRWQCKAGRPWVRVISLV